MLFVILGQGKTGKLVSDIALERGHTVRIVNEEDNENGAALTADLLKGVDAVIDFTTPDAVVPNMRAVLGRRGRMVVGTTGWYSHLPEMRRLAETHKAALLYGTNFSVGVQVMYRVAKELALAAQGYAFHITETHHTSKKDAPSGTALSIKQVLETANPTLQAEISSVREGDAAGIHVVEARSQNDVIELRHEAFSRRGFAEGAVRAAEWVVGKTGCWDFREIFEQLR
jgi:4-hydroxy-tetrahydrodipicolinate reductase